MSDPLSLLRENFIKKQPMTHDDHNIFIGSLRFPRSTVTAYKQDRGRGEPYTLDALYFLLQKPHLAGAANTRSYNSECLAAGFSKVLLADQKDVLSYLQGRTETSQYLISIDELAAIATPTPVEPKATTDRALDKRQREEAKLDFLDEELSQAKRHLAERLSQRPLRVPEPGKATVEARVITESVEADSNSLPYIKADFAVTRFILERENGYPTNKLARQSYMHSRGGRDFSHLISLVRSALSGSGSASSHAAGTTTGRPAASAAAAAAAGGRAGPAGSTGPTRYHMDQETAFKAAGIDPEIYRLQQQQRGLLSAVGTDASDAAGGGGDGKGGSSGGSSKPSHPIILVPKAPSSLINMLNVKDLLEKGTFKTPEEKKQERAKREERVVVVHEEGGHNYHYKVLDNAKDIPPDQWDRVVAVFVQGPEWQFREYNLDFFRPRGADGRLVQPQAPGTVCNMLAKTAAFHVSYAREPLHDNIPKWKVTVLPVHKADRHSDNMVMNKFWDTLRAQGRLISQQKAKYNTLARA